MSTQTKRKREEEPENLPLKGIDEWESIKEAKTGSPEGDAEGAIDPEDATFNPVNADKKKEEFRNYDDNPRKQRVTNFYHLQHSTMTYDYVLKMEEKYLAKYAKKEAKDQGLHMSIWEALEYLDQIVDDSDPDTNLSQITHALQTAEAIREKYPDEEHDWYPLVGLIHDLGKLLAVKDEKIGLQGEPQWAVVGDTFPVGLPFSDKCVFADAFDKNPDKQDKRFQKPYGVYSKGCGLFNVHMSWGHDEYIYQVCVNNKSTLPIGALYMLRYHSFYPWHKEGAYLDLMDDQDKENLKWVKDFNQFDLYSKSAAIPDVEKCKPYYQKLIAKYFPEKLWW